MVPEKYLCPECKAEPRGTVEIIPGIALVTFGEDGKPVFGGETKVCWDGQTTDRNAAGEILFQCGACFHEYGVAGVTVIE